MSGELTKRIQETEISSFHDVNNAQDELDMQITEPLEKVRNNIIAKRTECEVLLEEAAAAEKLTERAAKIDRVTAREATQDARAKAENTSSSNVGARRTVHNSGLRLRMAKMDLPGFSGKMKDYPSF